MTLARHTQTAPAPVPRPARRRLLVAGLVPLLAALAFSVKAWTMVNAADEGRDAFGHGDYANARDAFARNRTANLLETWIAPYDEGTARYGAGDFAGAAEALREALGLTPPPEQVCRVRVNLALAHEALGDSALAGGNPAPARSAWQEGLDVLEVGHCLTETGTVGDAARTVDARLRDKLGDPSLPPDATDPQDSETAAETLARLNERAERLRRRAEQRQQDKQDSASPTGSDDQPENQW